jgi:hypothetical protein
MMNSDLFLETGPRSRANLEAHGLVIGTGFRERGIAPTMAGVPGCFVFGRERFFGQRGNEHFLRPYIFANTRRLHNRFLFAVHRTIGRRIMPGATAPV